MSKSTCSQTLQYKDIELQNNVGTKWYERKTEIASCSKSERYKPDLFIYFFFGGGVTKCSGFAETDVYLIFVGLLVNLETTAPTTSPLRGTPPRAGGEFDAAWAICHGCAAKLPSCQRRGAQRAGWWEKKHSSPYHFEENFILSRPPWGV